MLRALRWRRARVDVVDLLLREGRVGDVHMLNYFSQLYARQAQPDATATATTVRGTPRALQQRMTHVQSLARGAHGSLAWLPAVYGSSRWCTSYLAAQTLHVTASSSSSSSSSSLSAERADAAQHRVRLSGVAMAAGGGSVRVAADAGAAAATTTTTTRTHAKPTAVQVVARRTRSNDSNNNNSDDDELVVATVSLQQSGVTSEWVGADSHNSDRNNDSNNDRNNTMTTGQLLRVRLHDAEATVVTGVSAADVAVQQHVLTAAAYAAMLRKLQEVCALHATSVMRYDALLIRNAAVQMRLTQLASLRYGVESLLSFVVGAGVYERNDCNQRSGGKDDDDDAAATTTRATADSNNNNNNNNNNNSISSNDDEEVVGARVRGLDVPLVESALLNIYAECALLEGMSAAWAIVRDTPLTHAQPHRSTPDVCIDYPYVAQLLLHTPHYALTSLDGALEQQAMHFLVPLLLPAHTRRQQQQQHSSGSRRAHDVSPSSGIGGALSTLLQRVCGVSSTHTRLTTAHASLAPAAKLVERDVAALLQMLHEQRHVLSDSNSNSNSSSSGGRRVSALTEPCFVIAMSQYVAELLASVAVLCRSTAALYADEAGNNDSNNNDSNNNDSNSSDNDNYDGDSDDAGHRAWLLAQVFCESSAARRRGVLTDYRTAHAVRTRALRHVADLDRYTTHPVELMNAPPPPAAAATTTATTATATTTQ